MIYPEFLKKNGCIELIAPSFGCTFEPYKSQLEASIEKFKNLGYKIITRDNVYKDDGIGKSTDAVSCAKEINNAFANLDSDIVYSVAGGETMCEDLPYIDFDKIKNGKPKWYIGYSDNTNLTFLLTTICDMASIYGQCFPSFAQNELHPSLLDLLSVIKGEKTNVNNYDKWQKESLKDEEHPYVPYNCTEDSTMCLYNGKETEFSGRLVGGCLDCLINLAGTTFDKVKDFNEKYKDDGIIWFLEACDLNIMAIRRALWQLKNAGWFKYVKGFLIGRPLHFDDEMFNLNRYNCVTDMLKEYNVPIILDCDIGHLPPTMPIITGAYANITYKDDKLNIKYILK